MNPSEACAQHHEIFNLYQAKFRELHAKMEAQISEGAKSSQAVIDKLAEIEALKQSAKNISDEAILKYQDAKQRVEAVNSKLNELASEDSRLKALREELERQDLALSTQREDLRQGELKLAKRIKAVEMDERVVAYDRAKIEKLIRDNKIKSELSGA